jgi:hypothetical protein
MNRPNTGPYVTAKTIKFALPFDAKKTEREVVLALRRAFRLYMTGDEGNADAVLYDLTSRIDEVRDSLTEVA